MTLSQFIKQETSLSNYEIAKLCKGFITKSNVYSIMNNEQQPKLCIAFKMFKTLNISKEKVAEFYKQYGNE